MNPLVSVVVPTRDRPRELSGALASIFDQSFRDFEIVVVDDGSRAEIEPLGPRAGSSLRVSRLEPARGAAAARNHGVSCARGRYVAFLDDDDRWLPTFLETQVEALQATDGPALSWTGTIEVDRAGGRFQPGPDPWITYPSLLVELLADCPIPTLSAVACRRSLFDLHGGLDERLAVVHDLEWFVRLLLAGESMHRVGQALVERRVPGGLVARHREWYREERDLESRILAAVPEARRHRGLVRARRELLFARIGTSKREPAFTLARLAAALAASPSWTLRIATRRLLAGPSGRGRRGGHAWQDASSAEESR